VIFFVSVLIIYVNEIKYSGFYRHY